MVFTDVYPLMEAAVTSLAWLSCNEINLIQNGSFYSLIWDDVISNGPFELVR